MKTRNTYSKEFKDEAIRLSKEYGLTFVQVEKELGLARALHLDGQERKSCFVMMHFVEAVTSGHLKVNLNHYKKNWLEQSGSLKY